MLDGGNNVYEICADVRVIIADDSNGCSVRYEFDQGQFRTGALRTLLIDSRQTFADALNEDPTLPRLSNRVVLSLANTPPEVDIREMLADGEHFGVQLLFEFRDKQSSA